MEAINRTNKQVQEREKEKNKSNYYKPEEEKFKTDSCGTRKKTIKKKYRKEKYDEKLVDKQKKTKNQMKTGNKKK